MTKANALEQARKEFEFTSLNRLAYLNMLNNSNDAIDFYNATVAYHEDLDENINHQETQAFATRVFNLIES